MTSPSMNSEVSFHFIRLKLRNEYCIQFSYMKWNSCRAELKLILHIWCKKNHTNIHCEISTKFYSQLLTVSMRETNDTHHVKKKHAVVWSTNNIYRIFVRIHRIHMFVFIRHLSPLLRCFPISTQFYLFNFSNSNLYLGLYSSVNQQPMENAKASSAEVVVAAVAICQIKGANEFAVRWITLGFLMVRHAISSAAMNTFNVEHMKLRHLYQRFEILKQRALLLLIFDLIIQISKMHFNWTCFFCEPLSFLICLSLLWRHCFNQTKCREIDKFARLTFGNFRFIPLTAI